MKATIYMPTEFLGNIIAMEAHLYEHGRKQYAQYPDRPYAFLRFKRKQHDRWIYPVTMLIVEGWNAPIPDGMYFPGETVGGVTIRRGRYGSFSPGWQHDFNAMINPLIEAGKVKVVADYR